MAAVAKAAAAVAAAATTVAATAVAARVAMTVVRTAEDCWVGCSGGRTAEKAASV